MPQENRLLDPSGTDQDAIRTLLKSYEQALNTADPVLAVSCYADDGVLMAQGSRTVRSGDLPETYERIFQMRAYEITFTIDEIEIVAEDVAYAITHTRGMLTVLADGTRYAGANREMFVLRRVAGRWRIARYLFNNDALPPGS